MQVKVKGQDKRKTSSLKIRALAHEEFVRLPGGTVIGEIPTTLLRLRRGRFRRMDAQQMAALHDSVERLGLKDPITVIRAKDVFESLNTRALLD